MRGNECNKDSDESHVEMTYCTEDSLLCLYERREVVCFRKVLDDANGCRGRKAMIVRSD